MNPLLSPLHPTDAADARCRSYLAALPECDPPDALWQRVQAAQAMSRGRGRPARWPWLASAAALAFAAVLVARLQSAPAPDGAVTPVAAVSTSTATESVSSVVDPASRASLSRIDAELTRAYERNADAAELDALWQTRRGMVDSLASNASAQLLQL